MDSKIDFSEILENSPVFMWRVRYEEDMEDEEIAESKYNESVFDTMAVLIQEFIKELSDLNGNNNRESILSAVKKFVLQINVLNEKIDFIETGEREDICDYIDKAITKAGLELIEYEDVTEEWREW